MTYRFALTGTHGTGKSYILAQLKEYFEFDHSVITQDAVSRRIGKVFPANQQATWLGQLLNPTLRHMGLLEGVLQNPDLFLADRTSMDALAYTRWIVKNQEMSDKDRTMWGHTLAINEEIVRREMSMWDKVFFKPIHPDHVPEADEIRATSSSYQRQIENEFKELLYYDNSIQLIVLPVDRDEAADVMKEHIERRIAK